MLIQENTNASHISAEEPDMLEAALSYAAQGIQIFPCRGSIAPTWKEAKTPLTPNGFKDATIDPNQITEWWTQWPDAFIGIPTGATNNIAVIDIDSKEDKDFLALLAKCTEQLKCPVVKTGKGWHFYFTDYVGLRSTTNVRKGIDIRASGGYVIAPPSKHRQTGQSYKWLKQNLDNIPQLPDELVQALMPDMPVVTIISDEIDNPSLFKIAELLDDVSADDYDEWVRVGMALKNDFGDDGFLVWDDWSRTSDKYNAKIMQKKWQSFTQRGITCGTIYHIAKSQNPDTRNLVTDEGWPEPQPIKSKLPAVKSMAANMLPDSIRPWIADTAERMECPIDYVAVGAAVALGSLIGSRCGIQPKQKDDWHVTPNLWGAIVAQPGMKKSPAIEASTKFLHTLEGQHTKDYEAQERDYLAAKELYEAAKSKKGEAKENTKPMPISEPSKPIMKRHIVNNSTVEKLGELLVQNPQGLLVMADELSGLLAKLDNRDYATDRAFFLQAWNGSGGFHFDTIGRGSTHVPSMCLSVLGSIQPDRLQQYLNKTVDEQNNDGMLQRLQLLIYPDTPEYSGMVDKAPNVEARQRAEKLFADIASVDFVRLGARHGNPSPYFKFSIEAQPLFTEWMNALEIKLRSGNDTPVLTQHLSKYRSLMPSLALIFHLTEIAHAGRAGDVSAEATRQAIAWCEYLESHARRVYAGSVGNDYGTVQLAKKLQAGKYSGIFHVRDIYRNEPLGLHNEKLAKAACQALEVLGWLRRAEGKGFAYQVNPKLLSAQTLH